MQLPANCTGSSLRSEWQGWVKRKKAGRHGWSRALPESPRTSWEL